MDATYTFGKNSEYKISLESMDYALLPIDKLIDKYHTKETCIKMRIFDVENEHKFVTKGETDVLEAYFEYEIESVMNDSENLKESCYNNLKDKENLKHKTKHCYICRINVPKKNYHTHVSSSFHILNLKIVQDSVNRLNGSMIHDLNNTHHDMTTEHGMTDADHDLTDEPLFCTICNETYLLPLHIYSQKHSINLTKLKLMENFTNFYLDNNFSYTTRKHGIMPKCGKSYNVQQLKGLQNKENVQPPKKNHDLNEQPKINAQEQLNIQSQKQSDPLQKKMELVKKVQPEKKLQSQNIVQPQKNLSGKQCRPTSNSSDYLDVWSDASSFGYENSLMTLLRPHDYNPIQIPPQESNQEEESEFHRIVGTAKITKDSKVHYFCHHCEVPVPRNLKNLSSHLKGKTHKSKLTAEQTKPSPTTSLQPTAGQKAINVTTKTPVQTKTIQKSLVTSEESKLVVNSQSNSSKQRQGEYCGIQYNIEKELVCPICLVKVPNIDSNILEHNRGNAHINRTKDKQNKTTPHVDNKTVDVKTEVEIRIANSENKLTDLKNKATNEIKVNPSGIESKVKTKIELHRQIKTEMGFKCSACNVTIPYPIPSHIFVCRNLKKSK